jgi:hypothetical protein
LRVDSTTGIEIVAREVEALGTVDVEVMGTTDRDSRADLEGDSDGER